MKKGFIVSLAVLSVVGILFYFLRNPAKQAEQSFTDACETLGQRAAEEVSRLLGSKGEIVIFHPEIAPGEDPSFTTLMMAFERSVRKGGGKISAVKTMPGGVRMLMMGQKPSLNDFKELLNQASNAGVVVSFLGLPHLSVAELQKLRANGPSLVIVEAFDLAMGAVLQEMVVAKAVDVAFVPRTPAEREKDKGQLTSFNHHYKVLRMDGQSAR
jgi:hypothetical protein